MRSFLRMAGISQEASPEEVLPLLARNIEVLGYLAGKPTEYLNLMMRYLVQARELTALAGPAGVIRVSSCADAKPLLGVLGYRLREDCGPDATLETADPERAFLTLDSAFPLADFEEALRSGQPFSYPFSASQIPVLFAPGDWTALGHDDKSEQSTDVVSALLHDPGLARLYWALSRMDGETRMSLGQSPGLRQLLPYAAALDFYGGQISIRSGKVVVPGGAPVEPAWEELVGEKVSAPRTVRNRSAGKR